MIKASEIRDAAIQNRHYETLRTKCIEAADEIERLQSLVKKAADWIDPDCSPPALYSEREIVAELRQAVQ